MSQVLPSVGRSRAGLFLLTFLNCWLISTPVLFIWTCQLDYYSGSLGLPLSCIFNSLRNLLLGIVNGLHRKGCESTNLPRVVSDDSYFASPLLTCQVPQDMSSNM